MADTADKPELSKAENLLLSLDVGMPGALYRMLLGAIAFPLEQFVLGPDFSATHMLLFFLASLLALRFGTAVARKLMPVSARLKEAWSVRRRTAKYFDSYQWRKLLWFGLGMALYMLPSGHFISQPSGLAAFCIATGAFGTARWRIVSASSEYAKPSARKIK